MIQLAHHLHATIIAEGVESVSQLERLRTWDCDAAQGDLFCPSVDAKRLCEFMRNPSQNPFVGMLRRNELPLGRLAIPLEHTTGPDQPTTSSQNC
jgi:EAL domain-containing protein (putative c-di-GMP-specific phosphodiesterase class I)